MSRPHPTSPHDAQPSLDRPRLETESVSRFAEVGLVEDLEPQTRTRTTNFGTIHAARAEEVVVRDFARPEFVGPRRRGPAQIVIAFPTVDYRVPLHTRPFPQAQLDSLFERTVDIETPNRRADFAQQSRADFEDSLICQAHRVARNICSIFESNEPFSLYRQPVFHDPVGPNGYLSFRQLCPARLAQQLRPYILNFRYSVGLIQSQSPSSKGPPLPPYCEHVDAGRGETADKSLLDLQLDCLDGFDVTGFYLLCELFWKLVAQNKRTFSRGSKGAKRIGGCCVESSPRKLRTRFDSVLDLVEDNLCNEAVHEIATELENIICLSLDKVHSSPSIPPPLQASARLLGTKYSDATASDHFLAALREPFTSESTTAWDHLQYLAESPLDFDPQDPNLSLGLKRYLDKSAAYHNKTSVSLRGRSGVASFPGEALLDYATLEEYQQQTPSTYYTPAKPILHLYAPDSNIVLQGSNAISKLGHLLGEAAANGANGTSHQLEGSTQNQTVRASVTVESTALLIWAETKGVRIEYPSIGIHGVSTTSPGNPDSRALFVQLNLYDQDISNSDDDIETADILIIPNEAPADTEASGFQGHKTTVGLDNEDAVNALYNAVSDCQNLHPDPQEDEDEDEGSQQPAIGTSGLPGDGGWITSENMAQFMDSNGNFVGFGGAESSEGAVTTIGTRRRREEDEDKYEDAEDGETKWQRTD